MDDMTKIALALATGTLLSVLGFSAASAAPLMPSSAPIVAGEQAVDQVIYRHHHHPGVANPHARRHHHRHLHRHRRVEPRAASNPNARNVQQPGYMQQKGGTSGGPRY